MAGRPKQRALVAELERRAREEIGDNATALDYVVSWVASGKTQLALVEDISAAVGMDIMHATMAKYLRDRFGDEANVRLDVARREGAHVMVDDAIGIIEDADDTSREKLQHAKMRADIRMWTAGKFNREAYGDTKNASISISIAGLHLSALRQASATLTVIEPSTTAPKALGSTNAREAGQEIADAEIVALPGADEQAELEL